MQTQTQSSPQQPRPQQQPQAESTRNAPPPPPTDLLPPSNPAATKTKAASTPESKAHHSPLGFIQIVQQNHPDQLLEHLKCLQSQTLAHREKQLNKQDANGYSALHWAAHCDESWMCQKLIQNGANINTRTKRGETFVHRACARNSLRVLRALNNTIACPKSVLDASNSWGESALHLAAGGGHCEAVRALLDAKAHINPKDKWDRTPSQVALENGEKNCSKLLFQLGGVMGKLSNTKTRHEQKRSLLTQFGKEFHQKLAKIKATKLGSGSRSGSASGSAFGSRSGSGSGSGSASGSHKFTVIQPVGTAKKSSLESDTTWQHNPLKTKPDGKSKGLINASSSTNVDNMGVPAMSAMSAIRGIIGGVGLTPLSKLVEYPGDILEIKRLLRSGKVDPNGKDAFGLTAFEKFAGWDKVDLLEALVPHLKPQQIQPKRGLEVALSMGALLSQKWIRERWPHLLGQHIPSV